jgi:hypothetical protein
MQTDTSAYADRRPSIYRPAPVHMRMGAGQANPQFGLSANFIRNAMKTLTSLYRDHLSAALFFADSARRIESEESSDDRRGGHRAFVIGVVSSAVSFLEARFNEFCEDPFHGRSGFPRRSAICLRKLLQEGMDRLPLLQKYQIAIFLAGKNSPLEEGEDPYQSAKLLIELRNKLVHFRPEWSGVDTSKLETKLRGRFAPNSMVASHRPFFPDRCLSYGCAVWSIDTAFKFANAALKNVGLKLTGLEGFEKRIPLIPISLGQKTRS